MTQILAILWGDSFTHPMLASSFNQFLILELWRALWKGWVPKAGRVLCGVLIENLLVKLQRLGPLDYSL